MNSLSTSSIVGMRGQNTPANGLASTSSSRIPMIAIVSAQPYVDRYSDPIRDMGFFQENLGVKYCEQNGKQAMAIGSHGKIDLRTEKAGKTPGSERCFPLLLYKMLEESSRTGNEHIVSWLPHGRAFQILSRELFEAEIMPRYVLHRTRQCYHARQRPRYDHQHLTFWFLYCRYFQTGRYSSFARQLGFYSFNRIKTGADKGSFYNECFLRGRPDLTVCIRRRRPQRPQGYFISTTVPAPEPNLHRFPVCDVLSSHDIQSRRSANTQWKEEDLYSSEIGTIRKKVLMTDDGKQEPLPNDKDSPSWMYARKSTTLTQPNVSNQPLPPKLNFQQHFRCGYSHRVAALLREVTELPEEKFEPLRRFAFDATVNTKGEWDTFTEKYHIRKQL